MYFFSDLISKKNEYCLIFLVKEVIEKYVFFPCIFCQKKQNECYEIFLHGKYQIKICIFPPNFDFF